MMAWPAKRIAAVELSRWPLMEIASAPAPQSPLTMICRSPEVTRPCWNPPLGRVPALPSACRRGRVVEGQGQTRALERHRARLHLEVLDRGGEVRAAGLLQGQGLEVTDLLAEDGCLGLLLVAVLLQGLDPGDELLLEGGGRRGLGTQGLRRDGEEEPGEDRHAR